MFFNLQKIMIYDFTTITTDTEGKYIYQDEHFYNEEGVRESRRVPLTMYKIARESLMGECGGWFLNTAIIISYRESLYCKIRDNLEKGVDLNLFDQWLLKRLVVRRFPVNAAAQLIRFL